jgi:hypothetical protein
VPIALHRTARVFPAALGLAFAASALAQPAIYSNGSADPSVPALNPAPTTGSGVAAPAGGFWSEVQSDGAASNAIGGFSSHLTGSSGAFRFADDFTVTHPMGWRIDALALFAYMTGPAVGFSPFSGVNLRIWNGAPWSPGSVVVFGDTLTNRMSSSIASGMYRTFNTTFPQLPASPDSTRLIWRTQVNVGGLTLAPGTYWLDWQYTTLSLTAGEAFSPPVTIPGVRSQASWNAQQLNPAVGGWMPVLDPGKPATGSDLAQDLPFILLGFAGNPPCSTDFDGDGDSGTDADIEAFFACLAGNCCPNCAPADYDGDGDSGTDADIEAFFRVLSGNAC